MSDYKRLTTKKIDLDKLSDKAKSKISETYLDYAKLNNALYEWENDYESGKVVKSPCKVGDTIYVPYQYNGVEGISFHKIYQIVIMENDIYVDFEVDTDNDYVFAYIYNFGKFNIAWLNKRFFLTKEEAENKLKELENGRN